MKKYCLKFEVKKDGKIHISGKCEGFNSFEILGLLTNKILDIQGQISGQIKPNIIFKRKIVKTKEATNEST